MRKPNSSGRRPGARLGGPARAFSLVEMLVVIAIIGILIALAVVTGSKVIAGGKARASADVIRVLDEARNAWQLNWDKPLPEFLELQNRAGRDVAFPMIDARTSYSNGEFDGAAWPSLTYFTALMLSDPMVSPIFEQLDSTFVKPSSVLVDADVDPESARALDITDAWGRPFRYVHPAFHGGYGPFWDPEQEQMVRSRGVRSITIPGGQGIKLIPFRRSYRPYAPDNSRIKPSWVGDADEGMCVGNTPYFYSPGDDGDPGTRGDNVYSTVPRFPVETRDFE